MFQLQGLPGDRLSRKYQILAERYRDIKLVIVGGAGWLNKKVDRLIKKSKYKDDIKILGYVSEQQKAELYQKARAFVWPSFYEGFGFPPLEAMSNGCPVITSLSSASSEICGGAAILVDPYKINEIAEGVSLVLSDKSLREKLISRGYERAKEFKWEKTIDKFLEIINNL